MKQTLSIDHLFKKFSQFRALENKPIKQHQNRVTLKDITKPLNPIQKPPPPKPVQQSQPKSSLLDIVSKDQMILKVQRIRPFLQKQRRDTQQSNSYSFNNKQDDLLCQILMTQNERLCSKFIERPRLQENNVDLRKPGCVFQVVFSFEEEMDKPYTDETSMFRKELMVNGFVVVTEILEFYESLGDSLPVLVERFKDISYVYYEEDEEYDYIRILTTVEDKKGWISIGFISKKRKKIFDQMMFLASQLTNIAAGKLSKNDRLKDIFERFMKKN